MIELAGDGKWPPAEKALWRYYSGENTTGWQAVEVSPDVPGDWAVVTCDLWRDFGSFTLTGIAPTAMGGEAFFDRIWRRLFLLARGHYPDARERSALRPMTLSSMPRSMVATTGLSTPGPDRTLTRGVLTMAIASDSSGVAAVSDCASTSSEAGD